MARDIGIRKRNEERLRYLNVLLTAINDVNQMINRVSDTDTLIQKVVDRLDDTRLFIDISIGLQQDSGSEDIVLVGHRGVHGAESWRITPEGGGEGPDSMKSAARSMRTVVVSGSERECAGCHRDGGRYGHSGVIIPMEYDGSLIGIFSVCFSPGHVIYKEEVCLLEEVVRDLTLARVNMLARDLMAKSENRFASALSVSRSGAWDWNLKEGTVSWSDGLERLFGPGQGEIRWTRDALLDRIHAEDRHRVAVAVDECLKSQKNYDIEYRAIWSDGSVRWIHEAGDVVLSEDGEPIRMLAIVSDISKRKALEAELRKALDKAESHRIGISGR